MTGDDTRPKSETRQRTEYIRARVTPAEKALAETRAASANISLAGYLRRCVLRKAGPRTKRNPTLDGRMLEKLMGVIHAHSAELNRIGNNVNQIAHHLNAEGSFPHPEDLKDYGDVRAVLDDLQKQIDASSTPIQEVRHLIRKGLGYDN